MTIDKRVQFDEVYKSEEYGTTTYYFTIEKSLLNEIFPNEYPNDECGEISLEFPTGCPEAQYSDVSISPTEYDEENDCYTDYEWRDIYLPYEEVEELIKIAENALKEM